MELKNITRYYPEDMPYGNNVQYFIDANGKDFYASFAAFTKKYKLCIAPQTGIICSIAEDVSTLFPEGFSIVETDEMPAGCDISGAWQFVDGAIAPRSENYASQASAHKSFLQGAAATAIAPLERAVKLNMATPEEVQLLEAWERYSVVLNRVDISAAPDIVWPAQPGNLTV